MQQLSNLKREIKMLNYVELILGLRACAQRNCRYCIYQGTGGIACRQRLMEDAADILEKVFFCKG